MKQNLNLQSYRNEQVALFLFPFLCIFVPFCGYSSCGFLQEAKLSAHAARFTGPSLLARQAFGLASVPSLRLPYHRYQPLRIVEKVAQGLAFV